MVTTKGLIMMISLFLLEVLIIGSTIGVVVVVVEAEAAGDEFKEEEKGSSSSFLHFSSSSSSYYHQSPKQNNNNNNNDRNLLLDLPTRDSPNYYDMFRLQQHQQHQQQQAAGTNNNTIIIRPVDGSNLFHVTDRTITGDDEQVQDEEYLLGDITTFIAFSDGTQPRSGIHNDAGVALLAAYHFNQLTSSSSSSSSSSSPIWTVLQEDEEGEHDKTTTTIIPNNCNVRLTVDIVDSQFSPIESTRIFTRILQRTHNNTIGTPIPTAVVGAYRSATTSPLAILTGINNIPQISYASTSTDFDVKEQFPKFGRTISSTVGEADAIVKLFLDLNATHIGILFVTDSFGSALQKSFQDAATEANIVTDSIAFSFSADSTEIDIAVSNLKDTQFKLFFVIAFEQHYNPIMEAATKYGIVGGGNDDADRNNHLWIFDGFDTVTFHKNSNFEIGSSLAMATPGIGIVQYTGGISPEPYLPGLERVPPLQTNPTTGFEKFRTAWRQALEDKDMEDYFRSKLPSSLDELYPDTFDRNAPFSAEPSMHAPFLYDAVFALGLSMCRAAVKADEQDKESSELEDDVKTITAGQIYNEFTHLDAEGASGRVKIDPTTGTRDHLTHAFVLYNVRPHVNTNDVKEGIARFEIHPSRVFENGKWIDIPGNEFIYADEGTIPPDSLPPVEEDVNFDMNYIGTSGRAVGYALMGIVMLLSIMSVIWLVTYRQERAVRSSQPLFLLMVSSGAFVMASTIYPLSVEDAFVTDPDGLNAACQASVWLYLVGAIIAFSALLAKTRGIHQAYANPELDFIHVTSFDIFGCFLVLFAVNLAVLITWNVVAPLEWVRNFKAETDAFGRPVSSFGNCSSDTALPFVIIVLILNLGMLCLSNWWAYQARNIETEYHESRYIAISMASILQAWCMGIPILIVVWNNPQAKFFVSSGIVFVTSLAVLTLIFLPKVFAIREDRTRAAAEEKRLAYMNFAERTKQAPGYDEHHESEPFDAHNSASSLPKDKAPQEGAVQKDSDGREGTLEKTVGSECEPPKRRSLVSFSAGAVRSSDVDPSLVGGIKVLHNPRTQLNSNAAQGRELSLKQLQHNSPSSDAGIINRVSATESTGSTPQSGEVGRASVSRGDSLVKEPTSSNSNVETSPPPTIVASNQQSVTQSDPTVKDDSSARTNPNNGESTSSMNESSDEKVIRA